MNCTHCGAPIAGNSKFCTKCGTPVAAAPNIDEAETSVLNQNNNPYGAGTGAQDSYSGGSGWNESRPQYQAQNQDSNYYGQQQQYNQPPVNVYNVQQPSQDPTLIPVSVGGWIGVYLLSMLPIINLIMMFVWAFSSGTKKSLQNYARAMLIMALIAVVLVIILVVILAAAGAKINFRLRV